MARIDGLISQTIILTIMALWVAEAFAVKGPDSEAVSSDASVCSKQIEDFLFGKSAPEGFSASGVEWDCLVKGGATPLNILIAKNEPELLKFLLDEGASPNLKDSREASPLRFALEFDRIPLALMLLDYGATGASTNVRGKANVLSSIVDNSKKEDSEARIEIIKRSLKSGLRQDLNKNVLHSLIYAFHKEDERFLNALVCSDPSLEGIGKLSLGDGVVIELLDDRVYEITEYHPASGKEKKIVVCE